MAARPLHGLHSVEQFAEFQRSMRLSVAPTGEAQHDAAERTSDCLFTNQPQVSCRSYQSGSSVVNPGFLTGISSVARPALVSQLNRGIGPRLIAKVLAHMSSRSPCTRCCTGNTEHVGQSQELPLGARFSSILSPAKDLAVDSCDLYSPIEIEYRRNNRLIPSFCIESRASKLTCTSRSGNRNRPPSQSICR
jgi:hypothetical protein